MDIKDIISLESQILSELSEILDKEKEVLIKDNASEIPEIVEKKKMISKKITLLETKRQEIYGNKTADDFVAEGLLDKTQVDELKKLTNSIKEKNETNLVLTKQSIGYIRMITNALNPNQKVVTYGNSGKIGDGTSSGLFTTKV
jgi:flagellar biosynthesis/type III secretory pathway chaperone